MKATTDMYNRILVGLDLSIDSQQVLNKAARMARACKAELNIAHVINPNRFTYLGDMPVDVSNAEEILVRKALTEIQNMVRAINYPVTQEHILIGDPAAELHFLAQQENVDLIVVGSHGRKGFALLLGSTPNSVLHGATCDVLATLVQHPAQVAA